MFVHEKWERRKEVSRKKTEGVGCRGGGAGGGVGGELKRRKAFCYFFYESSFRYFRFWYDRFILKVIVNSPLLPRPLFSFAFLFVPFRLFERDRLLIAVYRK